MKITAKGCAAALLVFVSQTQQAQAASCWSDAAASAAAVRTFDTMLMVGTLRCRTLGHDITPTYGRFVEHNRGLLQGANADLRMHFDGNGGLVAFDRYVTAVANHFGAGQPGLDCNDLSDIMNRANTSRGSQSQMVALADDIGVVPQLPGGRCLRATAARH
jgi:hypothetical protein